ncbi:unnamed protein product [Rotaria socialis]|uniref:Nephrocystin-3 n=1 Tax=Rotaria socialis TaxID=392032 RepID=A0A818JQ62_9BILA|nr:unnamed protein product [Rotaria socialis]CAF4750282.1 unnamed protein product [Rotaria socialis]
MNKTPNHHSIEAIPNRENIRLIYLNNSHASVDIESNLIKINPATQIYTDIKLCIDFIKTLFNEKVFLIISNIILTKSFFSIYFLQPIIAIFIYDEKQDISELKIQYPKIIDLYTDHNELLKSIQEKIQFIEKQTFIYSLFDEKEKSTLFLWHYMLINILKQLPQNECSHDELLDKTELFRRNSTSQQVVGWYSNECFLKKLLNRALHTADFDILYAARFFLIDLCCQIEHENIKNETYLIVYRTQIMSMGEIEELKKSIGYLIFIDTFLSASRTKNKSIFQQKFSIYENVVLEIHVDLSIETITLVDASLLNSTLCDNEILININCLFEIEAIEYDFMNNLWNIKIIANNDGNMRVNKYLTQIQKELDYPSRMVYFGYLLWNELGQINQAKNYFNILLKSLSENDENTPKIYLELGQINDEIKQYNLALQNYQSALDIYQKQLSKDNIRIASVLNYIGLVCKHMGNLDRAMDYYRQSLKIYESTCSKDEDHLHRTHTMVNLALAYRDKKELDIALNYLTQVYDIRRNIHSNNHSLLVNILIHIANVYYDKNDFNHALEYYQQILSIEEITYPNDHLNKATTLRQIGLLYCDKHDWDNALNYLNHTLKIRQNLSSPNINHPDIAVDYGHIGNVYEKMNNLDLAFHYLNQQFQIEENYLSFNHPDLIKDFDRLIDILKKQNQSEKAIKLCQEKLLELENILGTEYENNPRVARILVLIASIQEDKNPREAHQYYQQALEIFEHNKNEENFRLSLSTMINFYWKCRMFDRALLCQMKLLDLQRSKSTPNNQGVGYCLRDLARLYRAMNKSSEALKYFDQSLSILKTKYGSEHSDVKNIQKEILDLKEILKSLSSDADEDYNYRRCSNAHKELFTIPYEDPISRSSTLSCGRRKKSSVADLASAVCVIL